MRHASNLTLALVLLLAGCGGDDGTQPSPPGPIPSPTASPIPVPTPSPTPPPAPPTTAVTTAAVATLNNPWAMTFLPDGRILVTERLGVLRLVSAAGEVVTVAGTPEVAAEGQGGLLDVALDPEFASNRAIYLTFSERGNGGVGLAVARGTLSADARGLAGLAVIWRQSPKVSTDNRHYGGRIAFSPDRTLFVTAGDRHQGAPAQDPNTTLGKIVRINRDGSVPADNPIGPSGARTEVWSSGHRNPYGLAFTPDWRLFASEMGPDGGDEFNLITRGANYGWRVVSEGSDGGESLPRHATRPEFAAPLVSWTPVIAPGGMIQYTGDRFVGWKDDFVLAALVGQALVRVRVSGTSASEVGRMPLGARIREVEQGPDGAIWVLEDGGSGRLLKLSPA
jgi:glucose/arabinose dehydrogenase